MVTNGTSTRPSLPGCPRYISILDDTPTSSQDQILGIKTGHPGWPPSKKPCPGKLVHMPPQCQPLPLKLNPFGQVGKKFMVN